MIDAPDQFWPYSVLGADAKRELFEMMGRAFLEAAERCAGGRRCGRPRSTEIDQAMEMEATGLSRKEIYRRLGKTDQADQHALREAMRQRRKRARDKGRSATVTPTNSQPICTD